MLDSLKKLVEFVRPDLSSYMRFPVRGEVTAVDAAHYTCDVQPLDVNMSLLPKCRILSLWATKTTRIVALPSVGEQVIVGFENGHHDKPYIEGFLPEAGLMGLLLIEADKARIAIEKDGKIKIESKSDMDITCVNCAVKASGKIDLGENGTGVVTGGPLGTMPVCLVTGAPIPGSVHVTAKS